MPVHVSRSSTNTHYCRVLAIPGIRGSTVHHPDVLVRVLCDQAALQATLRKTAALTSARTFSARTDEIFAPKDTVSTHSSEQVKGRSETDIRL